MTLLAPGEDPVAGTRAPSDTALIALVRRAAAVLPTAWPLETFIAVNPLAGFEDLPFEEAGLRARARFGARPTLRESDYRLLLAAGRITAEDLLAAAADATGCAVDRPVGVGADHRPLMLGDLLMADLTHGPVVEPAPAGPRTLGQWCDHLFGTDVERTVDDELSWWVSVVVGAGTGRWDPPDVARGIHRSWRAAAAQDRRLPRAVRRLVAGAPHDPRDALRVGLAWCGDEAVTAAVLEAHLSATPGWASLLHRRGTEALLDYLAARMTLERALVVAAGVFDELLAAMPGPSGAPADLTPARAAATMSASASASSSAFASASPSASTTADRRGPAARLDEALLAAGGPGGRFTGDGRLETGDAFGRLPAEHRPFVWLAAHERGYRRALLGALEDTPPSPGPAPRHAAVFCIDPRSEGLRRHLEAQGEVATFGFAGFFAVAMSYRDVGGGEPSAQCPVLVEPRVGLAERPVDGAVEGVARDLRARRVVAGAHDAFHEAKDDLVGPYALADAGGWLAAPVALGRTLAAGAYGRARAAALRVLVRGAATEIAPGSALTLEEQVLLARVLCTTTGLHRAGARVVLVCGHGSTTENNPYRSALDCGACGGHRGSPNARIAATVLNRDEVRRALAEQGVVVPEDTWFVAGEHDTATDEVALLDVHLVPPSHRDDVADLARRLDAAGRALAVERSAAFPGGAQGADRSRTVDAVRRRSVDWAQVLPEWGLAGNAAFVVGPRRLTAGIDLGRRVFLHSYDADADTGGDALETILTAPMVVAQWINCQYYFSSVAPDVFGSGTKVVHNVTAGASGVVSGPEGDLRLGLPWQSVGWGDQLVHEPLRLLTVVEAPIGRIDAVIERNQVLRRLFGNGWVALVARATPADDWRERRRDGTWRLWSGSDPQEES